jgi:hypothetical protein
MPRSKENMPAGEDADYGIGSADPAVADIPGGEAHGAGSGETPDVRDASGGEEPAKVEDHAKAVKTPASVLAAVMQCRGWAAGKRVGAEEFKNAVEAFLSAPIGGDKTPEGEKQ